MRKYLTKIIIFISLLISANGCSGSESNKPEEDSRFHYSNFFFQLISDKNEYITTEPVILKLVATNITAKPDSLKDFIIETPYFLQVRDSTAKLLRYKGIIIDFYKSVYEYFKPFESKTFFIDVSNNFGTKSISDIALIFQPGVYRCQFYYLISRIGSYDNVNQSNIIVFKVNEREIVEQENLEILKSIYRNKLAGIEKEEGVNMLDNFLIYQDHPKIYSAFSHYGVLKYTNYIHYEVGALEEYLKFIKEHPNSYYIKNTLYIMSELEAGADGKQQARERLLTLKKEFPGTNIDKSVDEVLKIDYLQ